ncbi:hypothetical protein CDAR_581451 [Caerostris darwini]|uniref:Uncharacterized protein n=1 Tax=Caerostris darwini TaxID=1538125 RepID=A0AAV4X4H6_9ARAC|nr:hypothetical protein CDAR_581451 [Caerostris darwini]
MISVELFLEKKPFALELILMTCQQDVFLLRNGYRDHQMAQSTTSPPPSPPFTPTADRFSLFPLFSFDFCESHLSGHVSTLLLILLDLDVESSCCAPVCVLSRCAPWHGRKAPCTALTLFARNLFLRVCGDSYLQRNVRCKGEGGFENSVRTSYLSVGRFINDASNFFDPFLVPDRGAIVPFFII